MVKCDRREWRGGGVTWGLMLRTGHFIWQLFQLFLPVREVNCILIIELDVGKMMHSVKLFQRYLL